MPCLSAGDFLPPLRAGQTETSEHLGVRRSSQRRKAKNSGCSFPGWIPTPSMRYGPCGVTPSLLGEAPVSWWTRSFHGQARISEKTWRRRLRCHNFPVQPVERWGFFQRGTCASTLTPSQDMVGAYLSPQTVRGAGLEMGILGLGASMWDLNPTLHAGVDGGWGRNAMFGVGQSCSLNVAFFHL